MMAVVAKERPKQTGEVNFLRPLADREYVVSGTSDRTAAILKVLEDSPAFDDSVDDLGVAIKLFRSKISIKEIGGGVWESTVNYASSPNTIDISVTHGMQTRKMYQAIDTKASYDCINGGSSTGPGDWGEVPGFNNAINVNGDNVEGVDIEVASVEMTISKKWKRAIIPADYQMDMFNFADKGAINHDTHIINVNGQSLSFVRGSLRCRNVTFKTNSQEETEYSYHLAYQSPITVADNFIVGDSDAITMEGWDYGWVNYKTGVSNSKPVKIPVVFVVNQVYPYKDFSRLQLDL